MKYLLLYTSFFISFITLAKDNHKPNIIFIFSDDQSYETIGINGQQKVITPNLDKLTKEGTTFTHAYNMGAWGGAVCVASRAMLNTGAHLWHADNEVKKCNQGQRKTWSQLLSDAGYTTYISGKWHVQIPTEKVFDHSKNIRAGMPKQTKKGYNRPKEGEDPAQAWYPWDTKNGGFWEGGKHWSEVLADDGISFIQKASKEKEPFFMYLAFNAPHDPRQAPKEYVEKYPLESIELPSNYAAKNPEMIKGGIPMIRDEKLAPFPRTEYAIKVHRQEYFASITHMDAQIGKILQALEASGKADNTWIIFTSDHGLAVGHHGLVGKQNMYEHSMRAPFIIKGPTVKKGGKVDSPIYLQDAMATTLEIAGIKQPSYISFKSLFPLLKDPNSTLYDVIYGAYMGTQRMLVKGDWKIIVYPSLKKTKLFHLKEDPMEEKDLAALPTYQKKKNELLAALEVAMDEENDPMNSIAEANFTAPKKSKSKH